jgi:hypothetical protein
MPTTAADARVVAHPGARLAMEEVHGLGCIQASSPGARHDPHAGAGYLAERCTFRSAVFGILATMLTCVPTRSATS